MDVSKETDKDFLRAAAKFLQEKVLLLEKEIAMLKKLRAADEELCDRLSEELPLLRKSIFGSKAEGREKARRPAEERRKRKKGRKNEPLPHNRPENPPPEKGENLSLEEETEEHTLDDEGRCPKCGTAEGFDRIGSFEDSGEIEVVEKRYIFKRHRRQKYHCGCCKAVVTAPGAPKPVPGGKFSVRVAAEVAIDKFESHIPLERQRKRMEREGLAVGTKTLFGLTEHLYNLLYPLNGMIRLDVLGGGWIQIDESPMPFYNPARSRGHVWSMGNNRGAYYRFEPNRRGEVAAEMLEGYARGVVVTDGFSGYGFLDGLENVKHAFCRAHVLRKFVDALAFSEEARPAVDLIDDLYDIEHEAASPGDLGELRKGKSGPLVDGIDARVDSMDGRHLPSTSLGKAVRYYDERRAGLRLFVDDENVPIDNNMAERRQRCPVMGRKNFPHFKSINGADVGTFFYSVVESCRTAGIPAGPYLVEMAYRALEGKELESPFRYSERLSREIGSAGGIAPGIPPPPKGRP